MANPKDQKLAPLAARQADIAQHYQRAVKESESPGVVIAPGQFKNACMLALKNACSTDAGFLKTTRRSLVAAMFQAALDGLLPHYDGWFVRMGTECVWMASYRGLLKILHRSDKFHGVAAGMYYEGDHLDYQDGFQPRCEYTPAIILGNERGRCLGGWFCASYGVEGERSKYVFFMPFQDIEKRREDSKERNKGKESPAWKKWWDEMALKTVIRAGLKKVPLEPDYQRALEIQAVYENRAFGLGVIEGTSEEVPEPQAAPESGPNMDDMPHEETMAGRMATIDEIFKMSPQELTRCQRWMEAGGDESEFKSKKKLMEAVSDWEARVAEEAEQDQDDDGDEAEAES